MAKNPGFDSKIQNILDTVQKLDDAAIAVSSYFSVILSIIICKLIADNFTTIGITGSLILAFSTFFSINFLTKQACLDFRSLDSAKITMLTVISINLIILLTVILSLIFFFDKDKIFTLQGLVSSLAILNLNYYVRIKRYKTNMLPMPHETLRLKIDGSVLALSGLITSFFFIFLNYDYIKHLYSLVLITYLVASLIFYIILYKQLSDFLIRVKENKKRF